MPPPQSKAWSYFKRDVESKIVKCKLCNLEMTYMGGTSNIALLICPLQDYI